MSENLDIFRKCPNHLNLLQGVCVQTPGIVACKPNSKIEFFDPKVATFDLKPIKFKNIVLFPLIFMQNGTYREQIHLTEEIFGTALTSYRLNRIKQEYSAKLSSLDQTKEKKIEYVTKSIEDQIVF